jgi:ATP-dependent DNA helicase RecQ
VGEQKLDKYGDSFLTIIQSSPLPDILKNNLSDTVNETLILLNDGHNIENIASKRDIKISTVYTHIADAIEVGLVDAKEVLQLTDDQHNEIIATLEMNEDESRLKPVFDSLEGQYDYGVLKCVQASF